jgi:hypothetical protein
MVSLDWGCLPDFYANFIKVISYYARKQIFLPLSVELTSLQLWYSNVSHDKSQYLIYVEAGWIGRDAILMTGINSLFYMASSIPPYVYSPSEANYEQVVLDGSCRSSANLAYRSCCHGHRVDRYGLVDIHRSSDNSERW